MALRPTFKKVSNDCCKELTFSLHNIFYLLAYLQDTSIHAKTCRYASPKDNTDNTCPFYTNIKRHCIESLDIFSHIYWHQLH